MNKDETEYTGQETYVREKYDNRDWEFFPVGECFVKQYEDQLLQSWIPDTGTGSPNGFELTGSRNSKATPDQN